jgi:hypothetical protein
MFLTVKAECTTPVGRPMDIRYDNIKTYLKINTAGHGVA